MLDWKKYIITFIITAALVGTAAILSNYFNEKRVIQIQTIQDAISTDLLSSETQFSLLSELSCTEVGADILSQEISQLGRKIEFSEENLGTNNAEILQLKKFYSLLEVKDYLLMKRINERCGKQFMFAFYFYGKTDECKDCIETGRALTRLRLRYPELRVYSFDYHLDVSTIRTLVQIFDVKNTLPAIVIGNKVHYGLMDVDALEGALRAEYPKEIAAIETEKKKKQEESTEVDTSSN